jgi:uncharacterized repeat protein (TIGR01451 family)
LRKVRPWLESLESRYAPSVLYNESISGDLSNNQATPTALTLAAGTNSVIGTVNGSTDLQDWVTVHVPTGLQLSSLVLASYVSTDQQGFTGVQQGTSFVGSPFTASSYLGYAHFGTGATNGSLPATNLVGTDLLPLMGNNTIESGSTGFTPPLPSGDYTFLIQQLGASTAYQFDFNTTSTAPPPPVLSIAKSHTGNFRQGDAADAYTIHVSNTGSGPTSGTVTVSDTLPTGLSPTAADSGTINGWSVSTSGQTVMATRSDALAAGNSYPNLTVTVAVAGNAAASVTNTASVSGGGATSPASSNDPTSITQVADLTIAAGHTGSFKQGDSADTCTMTVQNGGAGSTVGTVTITDTFPTGLTPTAANNGTINGWSVSTSGQMVTATRSDVLAAGSSYPALALTVAVANNAPASVTNTAAVSGGGELNTANDSASDTTPITPAADLTLTKNHTGSFRQGDTSDLYTIKVTNSGSGATAGVVTVTDSLPTGLAATAADSGTVNGWAIAVSGPTITATRSDVLAGGSSYPLLALVVSVANDAPASVTNMATVSGGGELNTANDSASDPTTITGVTATKLVVTTTATATAGTAFNVTITAEDSSGNTAAGFSGTVTLASSAGADISPTTVVLNSGTATVPVTLTAAGSQTLTASFTGLTSGTATVAVNPGAFNKYLVTTVTSGPAQAGQGLLVSVQAADQLGNAVTSYSGPATVTASISPTSTASDFPATVPINSSGLGLFLGILDRVGSYVITAASGSFTGSSTPVAVLPGAPARLSFLSPPVNTPTGLTLPSVAVQVLDAFGNVVTSDNSDVVSVGIASGPGPFAAGSTLTATVHNGVATFSNLKLIEPGTYTLSELVPTLYTGPNSTSFRVLPLQVVPGSFAGTPSGFSLQFNAPFLVNSTTPVIYGLGFGALAPVPAVTLTQIADGSGHPITPVVVEGSVLLNTATNSLTFLETDTASEVNNNTPILPDGTYLARISGSAATGFQAINSGGGFLDGLGTGTPGSGDYTTTFSVSVAAANEDVVWVPATADGPGQPLQAPGLNKDGPGLPVYLNDSTGAVTDVLLTFNYDPTLLHVIGAGNRSDPGSSFNFVPALSSPGHAVLEFNIGTSDPAVLKGGQAPLGFVIAALFSGTAANPIPYKAKELLHLSNVSINGGTIPAVAGDAVHLVAYVGDADGNGSYSSNDAVLITRVALQSDIGFTAYPLVDPVIVADTDGSGFIPADAPLQVNEAGVGFPTANLPSPPIPAGVVFLPIGNNVDPSLSLELRAQSPEQSNGGIVTAAVNIDDADPAGSTGLIRAQLALRFDPRQVSISTADVQLGSVLSAGIDWAMSVTINSSTGEIAITLESTTPISSPTGGSLVTIDVHPLVPLVGATPLTLVPSVNPSGQQVVFTSLEDAQGLFTLSLSPWVQGDNF